MGYELAVYAAVLVVSMVLSYVIASSYSGVTVGEEAQKIPDPRADMVVTTVKEGSVLPMVYGTVRIAGNVLWYGEMKSMAHYTQQQATSSGGKGGGSDPPPPQDTFDGYDYWLSVWEGICMGKINLLGTYVADDVNKTIDCTEVIFNDGTTNVYPDFSGATLLEATVDLLAGSGGTWSLGYTNIKPLSVALSMKFIPDGAFSTRTSACKDDGLGNIVTAQGVTLLDWHINYDSGIIIGTEPSGEFDLYQVSFWYGDHTENDPIYATGLKGFAHVAWDQWYIGRNVSNLPNVNFVVQRVLPTTVNHANMANGSNPAAVIWDILTDNLCSVATPESNINLASFNAAADYWYAKGYGINFSINAQVEVSAIIEQILGWVGGSFYTDNNGLFALHAFDENEEPVAQLSGDDFIEFSLDRPGWEATYNDLRLNYIDQENDYVIKTFALFDPANYRIQKMINQKNLDLTCFIDVPTVSRRAWELLKSSSYPALRLSFKVSQAKSENLFAGCVIEVSNIDYGITSAKFRISAIEVGENDTLELSFKAEQMVEAIFDSAFGAVAPPYSFWKKPSFLPVLLAHSLIFELPWTPSTGDKPYYAFLGARGNYETLCYDKMSIISAISDFYAIQSYGVFSQQGVLNVTYPETTYAIDDEIGIIYTPHKNDLDPSDLLRKQVFTYTRFVLIDSEVMTFQFHLPYGTGTQYQILGVVRGAFGTTIASHTAGAQVWVFLPADNIKRIDDTQPFWVKMIPAAGTKVVDESTVTAITVIPTQKATIPFAPSLVQATVVESVATIIWFPRVRSYTGAGMKAEDAANDPFPFEFDGDFEYSVNGADSISITACTMAITLTGEIDFKVRQRINGVFSDWTTTLVIPNIPGTYLSDIGVVAY